MNAAPRRVPDAPWRARRGGFALCLAIATALHLGLALAFGAGLAGGGGGGGPTGGATITAPDAALRGLVTAWDTVPETGAAPPPLSVPGTVPPAPEPARMQADIAPRTPPVARLPATPSAPPRTAASDSSLPAVLRAEPERPGPARLPEVLVSRHAADTLPAHRWPAQAGPVRADAAPSVVPSTSPDATVTPGAAPDAAPAPTARLAPARPARPLRRVADTPPDAGIGHPGDAGQAAEAGASGPARAAAASGDGGTRHGLLRVYGARIRDQLARAQRYPARSTASGTAHVELRITRDGQLISARITRSAGIAALDRATLAAAHAAAPFPAAPAALEGAQFAFIAPISFRRP